MKRLFLLMLAITPLAIILPALKTADTKKMDIQGSWELVSYIDHQRQNPNWQKNAQEILYQKHINNTHFTWIKYNRTTKELLGMGGGTYIINEAGQYVENINFFYPTGSSELGQSIPFTVKLEKGAWHHSGYAKIMELTEQGNIEVKDSVKIEEIWSPVTPARNNKKDLIGTWSLSAYRFKENVPYEEYPDFTAYIKVLTATHFAWVKYDKGGDQIFAAGAGTYAFDGNSYIENVEMTYPGDNLANGAKITFSIDLTPYKWKHYGHVPRKDNLPDDDSNLIDEVWVPYMANPEDATAFY